MSDLQELFMTQEQVARWKAERENASARLELAQARSCCAYLLSQHDPVHSLGIDREALRILLHFISHHDKGRLAREIASFRQEGLTRA